MSKIESLINFQMDIYSRINKVKINFKKSPKERITKEYLEGRIDILDQLWCEFLAGHKELMKTFPSSDSSKTLYIKDDIYDQAEELYSELKCELKTKLAKYSDTSNSNDQGESNYKKCSFVKLPKINIPVFSGKYNEWVTFKDLFKALIDNNETLEDIQKLHYLKGYLTGEAEQLLRHIPVVADNYHRCWDILEQRYNNKKYLSHHILTRFLGQKNLTTESASALKELIDCSNDCLSNLANLGIDVSTWDIIIVHILTLKLDPETRRQWEFNFANLNSSDELPSYEQFKDFLTNRYRAIEFLDTNQGNKTIPKDKIKSFHVTSVSCKYCTEKHVIFNCKAFSNLSIEKRRNFVKDNKLCFVCLGGNHSAKFCFSNRKCNICGRKHNTLLHPQGEVIAEASCSTKEENTVVSCLASENYGGVEEVLLATALVKVTTNTGYETVLRALVDQGSQSSFVTEGVAKHLGLQRTYINGEISGVGGHTNIACKETVTLEITSMVDPKITFKVKALILSSITALIPSRRTSNIGWKEVRGLRLADPHFDAPNKIDLLLGAEVYAKILQEGLKRSPSGSAIAQNTSLGWIVSGAVETEMENSKTTNVFNCCEEELKHFRLLTVTVGTASAPYLEVEGLQQVTTDEGHSDPVCAEKVKTDIFKDDLLIGFKCKEEEIQVYEVMNTILENGRFNLQKWSSIDNDLIKKLKERDKAINIMDKLAIKTDEIIKIVGLTWNRSDYTYQYVVNLEPIEKPVIHGKIMLYSLRFNDPFRWVGLNIITAKLFIRKLCLAGINLDQEELKHLQRECLNYRNKEPLLTQIRVPSWMVSQTNGILEIHGFQDVFTHAAVVYLRMIGAKGEMKSVILISVKIKVAPDKEVSIVRLDFGGAVLPTYKTKGV